MNQFTMNKNEYKNAMKTVFEEFSMAGNIYLEIGAACSIPHADNAVRTTETHRNADSSWALVICMWCFGASMQSRLHKFPHGFE